MNFDYARKKQETIAENSLNVKHKKKKKIPSKFLHVNDVYLFCIIVIYSNQRLIFFFFKMIN